MRRLVIYAHRFENELPRRHAPAVGGSAAPPPGPGTRSTIAISRRGFQSLGQAARNG